MLIDVSARDDKIIIYYHLFYAGIVESGALGSLPNLAINCLTTEVWMPQFWNKIAELDDLEATS